MRILIVHESKIPVFAYGGTERVVWDLGKALVELGAQVTFLVPEGSKCDFASVLFIKPNLSLESQIPHDGYDVLHFQNNIKFNPKLPYLITEHGNSKESDPRPKNTVFVSKDHANRYGSSCYVYNGLNWADYPKSIYAERGNYYHFLGKGNWPVKNLKGAIKIAKKAKVRLEVLGANRLNISHQLQFTFSRLINFNGMVGGKNKFDLLEKSKGMIFPARWHEPFGLAVIESLYFGSPVFATPYGALPEIVTSDCGSLAKSGSELVEEILSSNKKYHPDACRQRAVENFSHILMGQSYLEIYKRVVRGEQLNKNNPILPVNGRSLLDWKM